MWRILKQNSKVAAGLGIPMALTLGMCMSARAATPVPTPYQLNPFMFQDETAAIKALGSSDIMMRRSSVEWLGSWTGTEFGDLLPQNAANRAKLSGHSELVPTLARAVREMPINDSAQAARLLAAMGRSAKMAIPAVCDAMSRHDEYQYTVSDDLLSSLTHICGGLDQLAPTMTAFLHDKKTANRISVASGLGHCGDPTFRYSTRPNGAYPIIPHEETMQWRPHFQAQIVQALAVAAGDRDASVRAAATQSLESITHDYEGDITPEAVSAWQTTVPPITRMAASHDPAIRLAALKVLAVEPANISAAASVLKADLHGSDDERKYAIAAICHASQTDGVSVLNVFLADTKSRDVARRRIAMNDLRIAALPIWSGTPPNDLGLDWFNDSRLSSYKRNIGMKVGGSLVQVEPEEFYDRFLSALVDGAGDHDQNVRANSVAALEQVQNWQRGWAGHNIQMPVNAKLMIAGIGTGRKVPDAIDKAIVMLKQTDPDLAKQLVNLLYPAGGIIVG